jgi:hypothetical protein
VQSRQQRVLVRRSDRHDRQAFLIARTCKLWFVTNQRADTSTRERWRSVRVTFNLRQIGRRYGPRHTPGEVGLYAGDVGLYAGDVGLYAGDVGLRSTRNQQRTRACR